MSYRPAQPEFEIVQAAERTSFGVKFRHHAVNGIELGLTHDALARLAIVSGLEEFFRALSRELEKDGVEPLGIVLYERTKDNEGVGQK